MFHFSLNKKTNCQIFLASHGSLIITYKSGMLAQKKKKKKKNLILTMADDSTMGNKM